MRTYSMDLRLRVLAACDDGLDTADVADQFAVSSAWVRRVKQRRRETGETAPRVQTRRGPRPALDGCAGELRRLVAAEPDLTPAELRDRLGVAVSPLTVWRMLRRLGLTFKKSRSGRPSRTARMSPPPGPTGASR